MCSSDLKFDARIDKREVLLTGFNGRNHDHSLHSVTFGPDGKFYFNHGNCSAQFTDRSGRTFRIGSTYDPKGSGAVPIYNWNPKDLAGATSDDGHVYTGGFTVRMNPDGTNAEVIGYNYRNSYEQTVTSFGDVFHNDNDDPPAARTSFLTEYGNAGFFSRDGRRTWQADKRPGQTTAIAEWRQQDPGTMPVGDVYGNGAPTGIVSYEGDALGAKWRGVLLSCETARNVVFGYFPKSDGAGYKLERFDFFTSNRSGDFVPQGVYRAAGDDEWLAISVRSDTEWSALVATIGDERLARPEWATAAGRRSGHDEIDELLTAWVSARPPMDAAAVLQAAGVPAGPVLDEAAALSDPHLHERGFFVLLEHPSAGTHFHPGPNVRLDGTPLTVRRAAPTLGQDNDDVFRGLLGLDDAAMAELEAEGHLGTAFP